MKLNDILLALRQEPEKILAEPHTLSLWAFLNGYGLGNRAAHPVIRAINDDFEGPSVADACSKAYLRFDDRTAFSKVIDALDVRLRQTPPSAPPASELTADGFMSAVVQAIRSGRPGMMLGELSVSWLAHCHAGFLAGLEESDPEGASAARGELESFDRWVAGQFSEPNPGWYKILRVYEGPGEKGLRRFAELWAEHHEAWSSNQTRRS